MFKEIAGAIGGLLSPIISAPFQHNENLRQRKHADAMQAREQEFSREQMKFQERMSSTARQREMADLKKAGLNPLLAALGGAPMAQGAAAGGGSTPSGDAPMQDLSTSALQGMRVDQAQQRLGEEIKTMQSQRALQDSQRALSASQKKNTDMDTLVRAKDIPIADIKNKAYEAVRPLVEGMSTNAKAWQEPHKAARKGQQLRYKKQQEAIKARDKKVNEILRLRHP